MTTKKLTPIIALAVCAVALAAVASVKNPVTRPVKVEGYVTYVIDLATGELHSGGPTAPNGGVATLTGLFSNVVSGNFNTGDITGTVTAANGDQIFWRETGPNTVTFTGGTGRFEGLAGGFTFVTSNDTVSFPDANTMVISNTYVGTGTATY